MITKRQKQVFDFITSYQSRKKYAPSLDEIRKNFKLASVSTAHFHVSKLRDLGYLTKEKNKPRAIEALKSETMVKIPLLGTIAAGEPLHLFDMPKEVIAVPKSRLSNSSEIYALRVVGDSMIDEKINDGDIVLVKHQVTAENGQKVVALIDNQEATLKKFYKERGHIRLQPANKNMEPIIVRGERDVAIRGIVVDIIKEEGGADVQLSMQKSQKIDNSEERAISPYYKKPKFILYHGDALRVLSKMKENSVDMIFADPPYNLSNDGFTVHAGRRVSVNKGDWDKSKGLKEDFNFHLKWIEACKRVLKPHGTIWISGTYHSIYQCGFALQISKLHILNDIAWFKPNAAPNLSCRFFTASHETLLWARKEKKAKHFFNYKEMKNGTWSEDAFKKPNKQMRSVWSINTPKQEEKKFGKHPTQKSLDLLRRVVLASTKRGDLIVDPFAGSSTTGIAAYMYERNFIGIDTEKKYLDLSIKRFESLKK